MYARVAAATSLERIGKSHPDTRTECVAVLTSQLERGAEEDPTLNGFLLASLLDLEAVESLPAIERAFVADWVDESVAGDWEDVQIEFGLKERREKPRRAIWAPPLSPQVRLFDDSNIGAHPRKAKAKARAKRKQEKKSRRKNRKR